MTLEERFFRHVNKTLDCWLWTAAKNSTGYGFFKLQNPIRHGLAHRVSWELANGSIPAKLCVLHKCDMPGCVNPAHLFLGTLRDNMADMASKNRGKPVHGESHHWAKIDEAAIVIIRKMWQDGITQKEIGREFGIKQPAVSMILSRKNWRHVV